MSEEQIKQLLALFTALQGQQQQLVGLGGVTQDQNSPNGIRQWPVGGPGGAPIAPTVAPSGVMFAGGSPYKPDFGPARLQNTLVGLRDLLNSSRGLSESSFGQALGAKLKGMFGGGQQ